jgi:hypothetical protein
MQLERNRLSVGFKHEWRATLNRASSEAGAGVAAVVSNTVALTG